jgi:hypothetical protein
MTNNTPARQAASKACHQALVKLETRAGIAEAAEKLRTEPASYLSVYDAAEPYSDKQQELEEARETSHQEYITRELRNLYFSVPDVKLRKQMIAQVREGGDLALDYWQQDLTDAARASEAAQKAHDYWWAWASVWGIVSSVSDFISSA